MKKLLFINSHLKVGGCEKSLVDVLNHFDYQKYQINLLLLESNHDYLNLLNSEIKVIQYPLEKAYGSFVKVIKTCILEKNWFSLCFRLIHNIAVRTNISFFRWAGVLFKQLDTEYDAIIAYRPGICSDLAAFSFKSKKKLTWWHHGEYFDFGNIIPSYEKMDCIVAVSQSSAEIIRKHYSQFANKVAVVPNMVDTNELLLLSKQSQHFSKNVFKIVTVGRMSPEKNMAFCIDVAKNLQKYCIDYSWIIIGDGEEYSRISNRIREEHMEEHIVLTGKLSNPYPVVRDSNVLVHPSTVESQGITILEAMALSVPVIVVDSAGPREYIQNMSNGIIMEPDANLFAEAIYKIHSGEINTKNMVDNAIKTVQAFSPDSIIEQIEELL